jgi:phosphatidylglycerophosphate synthase
MIAGCLAGASLTATALLPEAARLWWVLGAVLVQMRLLANMFDGMVAIETGQTTPGGELWNEVPDRVSDSATLVGLGLAAGSDMTLGFVAALLAVLTAYIRAMGKVAGAHQEFCGPMAKPQRMFLVTVAALWCGLTPVSWQPGAILNVELGIPGIVLGVIIAGCVLTVIRRLRRISAALWAAR